jgi:hypothetical protein
MPVSYGPHANLSAYHQSVNDELISVRNRIRQLIGDAHWLTDGEHKEAIIRRILRNHVPEIMRVGKGFVYYAEQRVSNQLDILLTDTRKPTLFKDDELVIVTPDAVRAVIEVKTKQSTTDLATTLRKLGDNVAAIRQNSHPRKRCLAGLFVHDNGDPDANPPKKGLTGKQILRALHTAANRESARAVDFVAVGSTLFTQYSTSSLTGAEKESDLPLWYLYSIDKLAPAYFISHIAWRVTDDRDPTVRGAWFPNQPTILNTTPSWISLQTRTIRTTRQNIIP